MREIQSWWAGEHITDYHLDLDEEEIAAAEYISKEKVQRMHPREVADILMEIRQPKSMDEILDILSTSTGRSKQELSDAIFGVGSPDDMEGFYEPTKNEKMLILFKAHYAIESYRNHAVISDKSTWTKRLRDEFDRICKAIPSEAFDEANDEACKYIERYNNIGYPEWLSEEMKRY